MKSQAPMHRVHWPTPVLRACFVPAIICPCAWGHGAQIWQQCSTWAARTACPCWLQGCSEAGPLAPGSLWLVSALLPGQHTGRFRANHTRAPSLGVVAVPGRLAWSLEQAGVHSHVSPWPLQGTARPLWVTMLLLGTRFMSHKENDK